MTSLIDISARLAAALANMPCGCRRPGQWPWNPDAYTCQRCEALALYEAHRDIVQTVDSAMAASSASSASSVASKGNAGE